MKYWRGYLTAAVFAAFTWVLMQIAQKYPNVVDMIYPYVTRSLQTGLAEYSAGVDFLLWQTLALVGALILLVLVVLMFLLRWNPIQFAGWVLAAVSALFFLHTAMYGLNTYAGSLAEDMHMEVQEYTVKQLEDAAGYYRDQANLLANQIRRTPSGEPDYPEFEALAASAGDGFRVLTYERFYPVFAGSTLPVKKLGWSGMYTSMQITGVTIPFTGEAAVNPEIPVVSMPLTMCHEMAHRMCIANERDANFAGYLACVFNPDVNFQYSANFMALRYCLSTLSGADSTAASRVRTGMNANLRADMEAYDAFFAAHKKESYAKAADKINDTYIKTSGDSEGVKSYGNVTDLLVNWYLQEYCKSDEPQDTTPKFDPYDPGILVDPPAENPTEEGQ